MNRAIIRPIGVESNHRRGAPRIDFANLLWMVRDTLIEPMTKVKFADVNMHMESNTKRLGINRIGKCTDTR